MHCLPYTLVRLFREHSRLRITKESNEKQEKSAKIKMAAKPDKIRTLQP